MRVGDSRWPRYFARSCDIFSWMYSLPVHSSMSCIHCLLGLPWCRNPSMIPSRTVSANCPALPRVMWPNVSTVPKTLIKMLFSMSILHCNNWRQSFPKLSDCPLNEIRQHKHVYLWGHEWCHKEHLRWAILQRISILYRLRILSLASTFYKNETTFEQQFT